MEHSRFSELQRLVERSIFHSQLKGGNIVSGVHVNLPVNGQMEHKISLERRMTCQTAAQARMEEDASVKILSNQLAYLIEHEFTYEKPVFQENEGGDSFQIGTSVILIDRNRIDFPKFTETKTEVYLDCCKEKNEKTN